MRTQLNFKSLIYVLCIGVMFASCGDNQDVEKEASLTELSDLEKRLINSETFFNLMENSMILHTPMFESVDFSNGYDSELANNLNQFATRVEAGGDEVDYENEMATFFGKGLSFYQPLLTSIANDYDLLNREFPELIEMNSEQVSSMLVSIMNKSEKFRNLYGPILSQGETSLRANYWVCLGNLWGCLVFYGGGAAIGSSWGCTALGPAAPACFAATGAVLLWQAYDCYYDFWNCMF